MKRLRSPVIQYLYFQTSFFLSFNTKQSKVTKETYNFQTKSQYLKRYDECWLVSIPRTTNSYPLVDWYFPAETRNYWPTWSPGDTPVVCSICLYFWLTQRIIIYYQCGMWTHPPPVITSLGTTTSKQQVSIVLSLSRCISEEIHQSTLILKVRRENNCSIVLEQAQCLYNLSIL